MLINSTSLRTVKTHGVLEILSAIRSKYMYDVILISNP